MLIILPSVNAALDVHNIEKGIFVLQCDIKYWFLSLQFGTYDTCAMTFEATESFFWKMMC